MNNLYTAPTNNSEKTSLYEEKVAIETVKVGDVVLSWNEKTGKNGYRKVLNTFVRETDTIYTLAYTDGTKLETTWNHPFWIDGKGFVEAKSLVAGDLSVTANGSTLELVDIRIDDRYEVVYNFEVDEDHTYFVGEVGVLVHNTDPTYLDRIVKTLVKRDSYSEKHLEDEIGQDFANLDSETRKLKLKEYSDAKTKAIEAILSGSQESLDFKKMTEYERAAYSSALADISSIAESLDTFHKSGLKIGIASASGLITVGCVAGGCQAVALAAAPYAFWLSMATSSAVVTWNRHGSRILNVVNANSSRISELINTGGKRLDVVGIGYKSFEAFKRVYGKAGEGQAWHNAVQLTAPPLIRMEF